MSARESRTSKGISLLFKGGKKKQLKTVCIYALNIELNRLPFHFRSEPGKDSRMMMDDDIQDDIGESP